MMNLTTIISATLGACAAVSLSVSLTVGYVTAAHSAESDFLAGAASRYQAPSEAWFSSTQETLRQEVEDVSARLESHGREYADAWKTYLHWHLLEKNLGARETVNLDELAVVRRWLYSNKKGLEYPFFAALRKKIDEHLDAVFTFSHPDLHATFLEKVDELQTRYHALREHPTEINAAALGRTLGWFERTRQLPKETAAIRASMSFGNMQLLIGDQLTQRIMDSQNTEVSHTVPIIDQLPAPPGGLIQGPQTLYIRGSATSTGRFSLKFVPNQQTAQARLIYDGRIDSQCVVEAGPVQLNLVTQGPVAATKDFFIDVSGLEIDDTSVTPNVRSCITSVSARSAMMRRIGERRSSQPASQAAMSTGARRKTESLLITELDEQVEYALGEIRSQIEEYQQNLEGFSEVVAPAAREGASPELKGAFSTDKAMVFDVYAQKQGQFGAPVRFVSDLGTADIGAQIHVSFFNNMAETILGGKLLSDEFLMQYAKILQAELPIPLMVHSRAQRWGVLTAKERPLEMQFPEANVVRFLMRIEATEIDGELHQAASLATVDYFLERNAYGEYQLTRRSDVELESNLSEWVAEFLHSKLDAFFAPVLDAGGVEIPEGGLIGSVRDIEPAKVHAENEWLVVHLNIPQSLLDEAIQFQLRRPEHTAMNPKLEVTDPPVLAKDTHDLPQQEFPVSKKIDNL